MAQSVKVNYILNLINTGTQMLFPLITFPYACRVIEADGIGLVNFFNSIIGYISLFTCLGIPLYAIREIARVRDDIVQMNRTAVEILLLHTFLTFFGYVAVAIICLFVPEVQAYKTLFLILSLTILFTTLGCEWFYQGIEDFKYITIRGLIVKIVSLALLFVFVKTKNDLLNYGWYCVFGTLGGNIFNFIRLREYIHRENIIFSQLNITRHLKPVLEVFSYNVVISIYLQLNTVLLGFMKSALAVGFFTAATKLMQMIMKLSSCLGSVILPRGTNLLSEHKEEEFNSLIQKSYDFTLALSFPLMMGLIMCAPQIIYVLCGQEFAPAILTSQIIAPIILMVGISGVMGFQVLYPIGKINIVTLCCAIGAVVDLLLNVLLIPNLSYNGTAIAYLGAEFATTVSMYLIAHKHFAISFLKKCHVHYVMGSLFMSFAILIISHFLQASQLVQLVIQAIVGVTVYLSYLLLIKDSMLVLLISKIKNHV